MSKKSLTIKVFLIIIFSVCSKTTNKEEQFSQLNVKNWAYQLQDAQIDIITKSKFQLIVMDYSKDGTEQEKFSSKEIQEIKNAGITPIAYISIGEAENYRFYWQEQWNTKPPEWLGNENPEWNGNYAVKYWYKEWKQILYAYLYKIIEQGFAGIYLDKVDEFEYWADSQNKENEYFTEAKTATEMINLIKDLANYTKTKTSTTFYIIPQNGEKILKYDNGTLINIISGWAAEDLFYNETAKWNNEDMNWILTGRIPYLDLVIANKKPVFSVDYVDDGTGYYGNNKERIDDYITETINKGYIPYVAISDRALDELNIINNIQP